MHFVIFTQLLLFQKVAVPVSLSSCNSYTEYLPNCNSNIVSIFSEFQKVFVYSWAAQIVRITELLGEKKNEDQQKIGQVFTASHNRSQAYCLCCACCMKEMKGNEEALSAVLKVRGSTCGPAVFPPPCKAFQFRFLLGHG